MTCYYADLALSRKLPSSQAIVCGWNLETAGVWEGRALFFISLATAFVKLLNKLASKAVVFLSDLSSERAHFNINDCGQWSSRKQFCNLCLIKFIEFSQHCKQFITVIFPHRWLYSSVPLTHLTPPGNGQCQPSASMVPKVITSGTEREHYVIIFNLSSVCYHSA